MKIWTDQDARAAALGALHLTDAQRKFAARLGDGDALAGIRRAVEAQRALAGGGVSA